MQSWPSTSRPVLPGPGHPVRLFDSASGRVTPLAVGERATLYVCGITPYDATHIGHAFTYSTFDLLHRAWLDAGHEVRYVQNVTDVDDPLLERAGATGEDWSRLAARELATFRADMAALNVLPPTTLVGVVESMGLVEQTIRRLHQAQAVYQVDRDLYFSIDADRRFGGVARLEPDVMGRLCAERGGDPERPGKRHPLDPLLWRAARPGEPAWDSRFGPGRPGWHVECTAIALSTLGMAFDIQGGGGDLAYPHHEMCASLAHVATESWPFARRYQYTGMVGLDGAKMSKSQGNLVFVASALQDGTAAHVLRLALHAHHYRHDWEWSTAELDQARTRAQRWTDAMAGPAGPSAGPVLAEVRAALADDLDAPRALRAIDRWAEQARLGVGRDEDAPGLVADCADSLLGVRLQWSGRRPRR